MTTLALDLPAAYELKVLDEVEDLRTHALELARSGAGEGTLIWAREQRTGRALGDKRWQCFDENLFASLLLEPEVDASRYSEMLYVAMVSLGNAVAAHVSPMTALSYGWPNDLCIAAHKIGAIWLDKTEAQDGPRLSITLSVNVKAAPEEPSMPAMSILEAEGTSDLSAAKLLEDWARHFVGEINEWADRGLGFTIGQWKARAEYIGNKITRKVDGEDISGQYKTVNSDGEMELQGDDGVSFTLTVDQWLGWDHNNGKQ